jgi:hypothetical protein
MGYISDHEFLIVVNCIGTEPAVGLGGLQPPTAREQAKPPGAAV